MTGFSSATRIHDSLDQSLTRKRVVLWYDPAGEWTADFDDYPGVGVEKRRVDRNEFATKVAIARASLDQRFLLYIPSEKPAEKDNWLLDLLLAGHEFKADRASLDLQEAGLTLEFKDLARQHKAFFKSQARKAQLKALLSPNDDHAAVRLKMLAVLVKQPADIDKLLLQAFSQLDPAATDDTDPVTAAYGAAQLIEHFWKAVAAKFGYRSPEPTLRDFAVELFRSVSPTPPKGELLPHGRVFLSFWKDSLSNRSSFVAWSAAMAELLRIETQLNEIDDAYDPGEEDSFEVLERFVLHRLLQRFQAGDTDAQLLEAIRSRRSSTWFNQHQHGYLALEHAIALRGLLDTIDLQVESIDLGLERYVSTWWQIDQAYRRSTYHARAYQQAGLLKPLSTWIENHYVNNYLLPLSDRWSDQVAKLTQWRADTLPRQCEFFVRYVQTALGARTNKRLFVVISDALRYEAARDYADRLAAQPGKGWSVEVDGLFGALPSYTQLGMASLLPGAQITINPADATAAVDGQSATGTDNRDKILKAHTQGRAKALRAEEFVNLNSRTEGRELTRDHDLIVIYHDRIDHVGDTLKTEADTFQAVEEAFSDLDQILRKIASLQGSQVVITADHGFLFQQEAIDANDKATFPLADAFSYKHRRFALGEGIEPMAGQKIFASQALGYSGTWSAVFPLGLGRFPRSGSGARFVHGGPTLQEVVVPVIKLRRERKDESRIVSVDLLDVPAKITTSRLQVGLFQSEPVGGKVLPVQLRVGLYAKADNAPLCEPKTLLFDSAATDPRARKQTVRLELSNTADAYNNQAVELRVERWVEGVNDPVLDPGKTVSLKLQRPFGRDFDDF